MPEDIDDVVQDPSYRVVSYGETLADRHEADVVGQQRQQPMSDNDAAPRRQAKPMSHTFDSHSMYGKGLSEVLMRERIRQEEHSALERLKTWVTEAKDRIRTQEVIAIARIQARARELESGVEKKTSRGFALRAGMTIVEHSIGSKGQPTIRTVGYVDQNLQIKPYFGGGIPTS